MRVGLHTGEPVSESGNYVGLDVHRAARICSAGHGGQILLSDAVGALAELDLPPDVRLRDLGTHRLKDLKEPVWVRHLQWKTPYVKAALRSVAVTMVVSPGGRQRPPAGRRGTLIVPVPAAVKGSACGPLRALDRFGRGHGFAIMTGGLAHPHHAPARAVSLHPRGEITQSTVPESRDGAEPAGAPSHRMADDPAGSR